MNKTYKCECGKEFSNPQAFNGHKSRCAIHHKVKGNYNEWLNVEKAQRIKRAKTFSYNLEVKKESKNKAWIDEQHKCERCGKIMTEKYGSGRFCSKSCANSRKHSKETKEKISNKVHNNIGDNNTQHINAIKQYNSNPNYCVICGKLLDYKYRHRQTCSNQCYIELLRKIQNDLVDLGKHKHWLPRNKLSYAEEFWQNVLINNDITFEHNFPFHCCNTVYFLDFYIKPDIDLEIDGKQHLYEERIIHDNLRDSRLNDNGIKIYRIPFVNPKNSDIVKKQIDEFLLWLKNIS